MVILDPRGVVTKSFTFRYKKYVMLDPRGVVTKMREAGTEESFGPADAPATIALGEEAIDQKHETYIYRPDLGEVPMISVPDTLPDLLGKIDNGSPDAIYTFNIFWC